MLCYRENKIENRMKYLVSFKLFAAPPLKSAKVHLLCILRTDQPFILQNMLNKIILLIGVKKPGLGSTQKLKGEKDEILCSFSSPEGDNGIELPSTSILSWEYRIVVPNKRAKRKRVFIRLA